MFIKNNLLMVVSISYTYTMSLSLTLYFVYSVLYIQKKIFLEYRDISYKYYIMLFFHNLYKINFDVPTP